ncbi:PTS transporter subunit EIIC [Enterococcus devriesei]|uniref:PTS transporter subunit EIIC n=1 Tax=Enterococcus devriesei TaxID=319970 RepID=UPI001C0FDB10|nr:PTS transporter subunit EIIC [Enterococcus devriesei]MBU5366192.1 PTS transporter subunit EIIC [Enterococcus devriesei]MDT2821693.1 PTS transporter subunit EIIC [Enterococcus devriesei]
MAYETFATDLIEKVGGKGNINNVIHCITRLRFYLNDESKADTKEIEKMTGVISVVKAQGQYQVVVGNKVGDMYQAVTAELGLNNTSSKKIVVEPTKESSEGFGYKLQHGINEFIGIITGSMIPVIGILAGAGIVKGLLAAFVTFGWMTDASQMYMLVNTIADGIFHFLPVILGFTAAQKLNSNPIVIAVVGGILIHPAIVEIASGKTPYVSLLGIHFPVMNYVASVFPILVAAWMGRYIEKALKKMIPSVVSSIVSPIVEILILSFLVLLIVGPVITFISDGLAAGITGIFDFNAIIGGAVYCALFPILVVFGMHWPLIPIIVNDLTVNGYSMMNAFSSVLMMGIAGAAFAVAIKTKKKNLKQLGFAATISQICGVGEPAIYGILLKYKRVFYIVTFANIIGGALAGALHLVNFGFAGAVVGFASFINPKTGIDSNFYSYLVTHIGTFVLSFGLTWLFGYNDQMKSTDEEV